MSIRAADREVQVAYPRLAWDWPGYAVRQHQPRTPGWPDFILVAPEATIFAEVKYHGDATGRTKCGLEPKQAYELHRLAEAGAHTGVLSWGVDGWRLWTYPYYRLTREWAPHVLLTSLDPPELARLTAPKLVVRAPRR